MSSAKAKLNRSRSIPTLPRGRRKSSTSNRAAWLLTDQLQSVSKWIVKVATSHARDIVGLVHLNSRVSESLQQGPIVAASQGRMRFLRGTEVGFDSENAATRKPATAALGEFRRLRHIHHSQ